MNYKIWLVCLSLSFAMGAYASSMSASSEDEDGEQFPVRSSREEEIELKEERKERFNTNKEIDLLNTKLTDQNLLIGMLFKHVESYIAQIEVLKKKVIELQNRFSS